MKLPKGFGDNTAGLAQADSAIAVTGDANNGNILLIILSVFLALIAAGWIHTR